MKRVFKIKLPWTVFFWRFRRYELSQDLLDKQIEMLERKYGGVKARNAALTIQRAFRRYTLLKKFAAITAMAKAEKRLSRNVEESGDRPGGNMAEHDRIIYHNQIYIQQAPQSVNNRPMPIRSMSLRERRHGENSQSPMPRSQSGRCEVQMMGVHQVNQMVHQHPAYNLHQTGRHTPSMSPSPCGRHQPPPSPCWDSSSQESGSSIHYYNPQVRIWMKKMLQKAENHEPNGGFWKLVKIRAPRKNVFFQSFERESESKGK